MASEGQEPVSSHTFMGSRVACHMTPATPWPLLLSAAMVPATWVPWPLSVHGIEVAVHIILVVDSVHTTVVQIGMTIVDA